MSSTKGLPKCSLETKMINELRGRSKGITIDQIMTSVGFSSRKSAYKAVSRMRDTGYTIDGNVYDGRVYYRLLAA